jgi:hypothetical protein
MEWNSFLSVTNTVRINPSLPNICISRWSVSGKFLVYLFYEWLSFDGVIYLMNMILFGSLKYL